MTIKEITTLRKSGHLPEALEAAETEFAKNSNIYTAGALFWCLNDLYKQQCGQDQDDTFERMRALCNDYGNSDALMMSRFSSIEQRRKPQSQLVIEAIKKAKNNENIDSDYKQVSTWYGEGNLDSDIFGDFGWLIYYALKQTNLQDAQNRKLLLSQYLKLNLPRPSILHSLILGEAIKIEHNTPLQFRIRDFVSRWGLEHLRDEDWEQYRTNDGHTLPSAVEKLIGVYVKELRTDGVESPDDFSRLIDKALVQYPKSQNMPYFKAIVLISQGKIQEALTYYKNLILQFPSKFYLWNQIAELIEDEDTKIGLLCKALMCGADDEFLGGIRLKLASLLSQKDLRTNAKYELEKYRETYQNKGWNLKPEFWQIYTQLAVVESVANNNIVYAKYSVKADEFIYNSLPTILAVKVAESQNEDHNHPGRSITSWILHTEKGIVRLRKATKFGLNRRTPNGIIFDVKLKDGKIVWIKEHIGVISELWLKEGSGEVHLRTDRNGKKYAIISGSYVGEKLLIGINDGQMIKILSIKQKDGRWSAISMAKI